MKEFNNWIPAQLPFGWGEPVMLSLASVAARPGSGTDARGVPGGRPALPVGGGGSG